MQHVSKICPPISETPCVRILTYCICQSPCLLRVYHEIPLYYMRFFSSVLNTNAVYRSLKTNFLRVIQKIFSKSKRSNSIHQFFNVKSDGMWIGEASSYSYYFVADKGLYLNSKLAVFLIPAIRGVAGGGMMEPSQAQNGRKSKYFNL